MGGVTFDPESLRRRPQPKPLHLNVRIAGEDVEIFEQLRLRTPNLTDSQRVRDSVRLALYMLLTTQGGALEALGVFEPEGAQR